MLSGKIEEKLEAISHLEACSESWEELVRLTSDRYRPMPYVSMGHHEPRWPDFTHFHWSLFSDQVKADVDYARALEF